MIDEVTCEIVGEYLINGEVYFDIHNELSGVIHRMIPAKDLVGDRELGIIGLSLQDIARIKIAGRLGLMESSTFH